jgi:hypothetical protein
MPTLIVDKIAFKNPSSSLVGAFLLAVNADGKVMVVDIFDNSENITALGLKVDKVPGLSMYSDDLADARVLIRYTDQEKSKLAGLDDNHWKGKFPSEALLFEVTGVKGDYASVDLGIENDVVGYIWDDSDNKWVKQLGTSTAETPSSIKSKYESNADTNAFTDLLKTKLITAYNWVSTNGVTVLEGLGKLDFIDYPSLTADGVQDFEIPAGKTAKRVLINAQEIYKMTANNGDRTDTFSQLGAIVTINQPTEIGNYIAIFYQ